MVNFGYPYNDIVICKDSTDYLGGTRVFRQFVKLSYVSSHSLRDGEIAPLISTFIIINDLVAVNHHFLTSGDGQITTNILAHSSRFKTISIFFFYFFHNISCAWNILNSNCAEARTLSAFRAHKVCPFRPRQHISVICNLHPADYLSRPILASKSPLSMILLINHYWMPEMLSYLLNIYIYRRNLHLRDPFQYEHPSELTLVLLF